MHLVPPCVFNCAAAAFTLRPGYARKEVVRMTCCPTAFEGKRVYICSEQSHRKKAWKASSHEGREGEIIV